MDGLMIATLETVKAIQTTAASLNAAVSLVDDSIPEQATLLSDTTLAAASFVAGPIALTGGIVYTITIEPDLTGGGSASDVIYGVYKFGSAPSDGNDGIRLTTGQERRIHLAAAVNLYFRKHASTDFPVRIKIWYAS